MAQLLCRTAVRSRSSWHFTARKSAALFRPSFIYPGCRNLATFAVASASISAPQEVTVRVVPRNGGSGEKDGTRCFSARFLRDHCTCGECQHSATHQRLPPSAYAVFPAENDAESVRVAETSASKEGHLLIKWLDGHVSAFSGDWLSERSDPHGLGYRVSVDAMRAETVSRASLWSRREMEDAIPSITAKKFLDDLSGAMHAVEKHGILLVQGIEPTVEATSKLLQAIGCIRHTVYGGVWSFTADMAKTDTAYTNIPLGMHTDGTYFADPPGLQCFHMMAHDGDGGETTLVDGFNSAFELAKEFPESFRYLTRKTIPWHHVVDGKYLFQSRPVLRCLEANPALSGGGEAENAMSLFSRLVQVSINNDDRAPMSFSSPGEADEFYLHYGRFLAKLNSPAAIVQRKMPPGTVLIVNNWRVLHGRTGFTGNRAVCGAYFNYEDYESYLLEPLFAAQVRRSSVPS